MHCIFKNVISSMSPKNSRVFSFLAHSFMIFFRFWYKFLWYWHWEDTYFFILWSMTSKVIQGHIRSIFLKFFLGICRDTSYIKMKTFLKIKYVLRWSHMTTLIIWICCLAFLLSDYLILWQPWLTFLGTTFVLVLKRNCI